MNQPAQQDIVIMAAPRWLAKVDADGNARFNSDISQRELDALKAHNPAAHTLFMFLAEHTQQRQHIAKLEQALGLRQETPDARQPALPGMGADPFADGDGNGDVQA